MAPSSSAKKVAKLASRGRGKKVRFSGGTTFPTVVALSSLAMVGLIAYGKVSMPSEASGSPQAGDQWTMAYEFRVCDTTFTLEGQPEDLTEQEASAGDAVDLQSGIPSSVGFINYRPEVGGNTGGKARLGVFLDSYEVSVNTDRIVIPGNQADGEEVVYDIDDSSVFDGTSCEGEDAEIKVRVWNDASTGAFQDKITDFHGLKFTKNGMAFVIAIVPADDDNFEIPKPATASRLEDFGVIGEGSGDDAADTNG
ncbi:MAG TPA: hypothetical protein DCR14_16470 [Acidimicrobiaceae bacterium]|nr:hypothetical protein [Acidimicrobiaceae bacterium]